MKQVFDILNQGIAETIERNSKEDLQDGNIRIEEGIPMSTDLDAMDNMLLTAIISDQEILETVKQIPVLKTPGPDGIQSIIYQKFGIVEKSVSDMVKPFFSKWAFAKGAN